MSYENILFFIISFPGTTGAQHVCSWSKTHPKREKRLGLMVGFGQAPPPWDVATILNSKDMRPDDVATTRTAICVNSLTMHAKNLEWVVGALGTASLYFFLIFIIM